MRRNRDPRIGKYPPFHAQRRPAVRRARSKEGKVRRDPELWIRRHDEYVLASLLSRWSDPAGCWGWSNRGFDGWMARRGATQAPLGTTRGAAMGVRATGGGGHHHP